MGNTPKLLRNWLWSLTVTVVFAAVLFLRQLPGYAAVTEEPLSLYVIYDNSGWIFLCGSTAVPEERIPPIQRQETAVPEQRYRT